MCTNTLAIFLTIYNLHVVNWANVYFVETYVHSFLRSCVSFWWLRITLWYNVMIILTIAKIGKFARFYSASTMITLLSNLAEERIFLSRHLRGIDFSVWKKQFYIFSLKVCCKYFHLITVLLHRTRLFYMLPNCWINISITTLHWKYHREIIKIAHKTCSAIFSIWTLIFHQQKE